MLYLHNVVRCHKSCDEGSRHSRCSGVGKGRDARYTGIIKYRGNKSESIIYHGLVKYRAIPSGRYRRSVCVSTIEYNLFGFVNFRNKVTKM